MSEENESKIEQKESFKEDETKEDNMPSMKNNRFKGINIDRSTPSDEYIEFIESIDPEKVNRAAGIIQGGIYHMFKARAIVREKIHETYEMVWDDSLQRWYFFNSKTGTSSWEEPILMRSVGRVELLTPRTRENMMYKKQTGKWKTAKDMTEDEAARKIQGAWRSKVALRNVREMVKKQYERVYDQDSNRYFYFNTRTQESFWERPKILGSDEVPLTPRSQVIVDQLFAQTDQQQGGYDQQQMQQQQQQQQPIDEGKQEATIDESKMMDQVRPMTSESNVRPMTSESNLRPMTGESSMPSRSTNRMDDDDSDAESDEDGDRPETAMTKYSNKQAVLSLEDQEAIKTQQLNDFLESEDLEDYKEQLIEEGFDDMEALLAILSEDVDEMGFELAAKRKLLSAIEKFREDAGLDSPDEEDSDEEISRESISDSDSDEDEFDAEARLKGLRDEDESDDALSDDDDRPDLTGITVETKFKGDGQNKAMFGQIVRVHYTATLEGSKKPFEDSRERGRAFEFKLGASQVVPGWENVIRTMTFGQRAEVTMEPQCTYGDRGHPPVIPPGATIIFDIQFIRAYYADADAAYEHQGLAGDNMIGSGGKEPTGGGVY